MRHAAVRLAVVVACLLPSITIAERFESAAHPFRVIVVAAGLDHPWGMTFLPDGAVLVTERSGSLRRIDDDGVSGPIPGGPDPLVSGQGGLLDIALHPRFSENGWVYFSHAGTGPGGGGTELSRARYDGQRFSERTTLFVAEPKSRGGRHFGARIRFLGDDRLLLTLGDRGDRERAQDLGDHAGSTIRLNDDGTVPDDNPFIGRGGARPEIFTYGNRNVQGLAIHPVTGEPWAHEHGPQGGDELNVLRPGRNYGWPVITYGRNYVIGTRIGEGTSKPGMEQPVHYWDPSIAPSGMAFYTGERFPRWQGNLFVGALKYRQLVRLVLDGERVVTEERLLDGAYGRIRDVRDGPDGYLYLLTDDSDGRLLRLEPAS